MKKSPPKPFVLSIILVVLYLLALFLGVCAISASPILKQKTFFVAEAHTAAQEYLAGSSETIGKLAGPNMRIFIYDTEGHCLLHMEPRNANPDADFCTPLPRDLSAVLAGKDVFHPMFSQETQRSLNDIMIMTGVPIKDGGHVVGGIFLIRNLIDLPMLLLSYIVFFTVFYWLSAVIIVSNFRRKRKLDELQQNYIANVTHALKTPVASIKALSETLCDGVEPDLDQQRVYYGMILREANRQDHMIRDILELSKLQSHGMDFTKTKLNALKVFEPVLEKYGTLADCMGITLHVSENLERLPSLYTNAACMKQVLEILLDNALKFVPEDGDIWIDTCCTRKQATICVRDNGIGIAKDALPHIFERFYKYSHDFNASGSGLGLAIAKETIAGLKEKIWVESEPGQGAAFYFTVRLK